MWTRYLLLVGNRVIADGDDLTAMKRAVRVLATERGIDNDVAILDLSDDRIIRCRKDIRVVFSDEVEI